MAYMGDICVTMGSYTNQQGEKKNRYEKIGAWFQDEQGRISGNINMIPLIPPKKDDGTGFWFSLFTDQKNKGQGQHQQAPQQQAPAPQQQQQAPAPRQQYYDANGNPVSTPF